MSRTLKWLLAAAVVCMAVLSARPVQAQCVVCAPSKLVKHATCQPSTTGGRECTMDYSEKLGWFCAPLGVCGPTALQLDGSVLHLASYSQPDTGEGAEVYPIAASVDDRRKVLRPCDGAVVSRRYTAEVRNELKSRSKAFEI